MLGEKLQCWSIEKQRKKLKAPNVLKILCILVFQSIYFEASDYTSDYHFICLSLKAFYLKTFVCVLTCQDFFSCGNRGKQRSRRRSTIQFCFLTKFQTYKQNATIIKGTILYPDKPIVYVLPICFISTSIYPICCHFCEVFESKMNTHYVTS